MSCKSGVRPGCRQSGLPALVVGGIGVLIAIAVGLPVEADTGSAGPLAQSCGVPPPAGQAGGGRGLPVFPTGEFPVKLPPVSLLGAHNDLPNPYRPGVSWGQLPEGRKWGSSASVSTAPDGTI